MAAKATQEASRECGICRFISVDSEEWHFEARERQNVWHTVHLGDYGASGGCSCQHFDFRIRPLLATGEIKPHSARSKCRHIRRAEQLLLFTVKRKLFAKPEQNPK